jgi:AraC-like DNA-binding protein
LRDVVDAVIEGLDEGLDGRAVAARAMLSPFHFNRLVRAGIGEAPAAFRRRLLLERAAWRLGRGVSVTDAGLEAGYDAIEAFSRAFTRAHGVPPSRFADRPRDFRLAAPNAIDFHPPGGCCRQPRGSRPWISPTVSRARPLAHRAPAGAGGDIFPTTPSIAMPGRGWSFMTSVPNPT